MPIQDILNVNIVLGEAALPRAAFNTSLILGNMAQAVDDQFGAEFTILLTLSTWQAQLAALGLSSSDPTYLDVQAHFTQTRTPTEAYLGRMGEPHEQVLVTVPNPFQTWDVDIGATPSDGTYEVAVPGEAATPFQFAAVSQSQQEVVDALLAAFVAGPITTFTAVDAGSGKIQITKIVAGTDLALTTSGPAEITDTETQVHTALDGTYSITIPGEQGGLPFEFIASGKTGNEVAAGLYSAMSMVPTNSFILANISAGNLAQLTLTQVELNSTLSTSVISPSSLMTQTVTNPKVVNQALVIRIEIADVGGGLAADGTYTVTVSTSTGQKVYNFVASSSTISAVSVGLRVAYDLDPSDLATASTGVVGRFELLATTAGIPYTATVVSPNSDATSTVFRINRDAGDDVIRAATTNINWYMLLPSSHIKHELLSMAEAIQGIVPGHKITVQSSDADIGTSVTTDLFSELKDLARSRTDPLYSSLDAQGVHAAWTGYYLTLAVGAVTPKGRTLVGLTGEVFEDPTVALNIKSKNGSYLESIPSLERNIMLGTGFSSTGRPVEVIRILDTVINDINVTMFEAMVSPDIVFYSPDGIAIGTQAIIDVFNRAVASNYAVPDSLTVVPPDLTTATAIQRQEGELPPYSFTFQIQIGVHTTTINGTLFQ